MIKLLINKIEIVSKKFWPLSVALLIVLVIFLRGYDFNSLYAQIDVSYPEIGSQIPLSKFVYMWDSTRSAGELHSIDSPSLIRYAYLSLVHLMSANQNYVNFLQLFILNMLYFFCTFLALSSFSFLIKMKTNIFAASFLSLLVITNISFLQTNAHPLFIQRFDYVIFCIIIFALNRYVSLGDNKYAALLFSAFAISGGTWQTFPFWLPFLAFLLVYTIFLVGEKQLAFKKAAILWSAYFFIMLPFLGAIFYYQKNLNLSESIASEYAVYVVKVGNVSSHPINAFSFIGGVNWDKQYSWEGGAQVYPYNKEFRMEPFFIFSRFTISLLFMLSLLFGTRNKFKLLLLAGVAFSLFMIFAYHPPFGRIWTYLFDHVFIFKLFRESHNKFYPLLIFIMVLFVYLNNFKKRNVQFIAYGIFVVNVLAFLLIVGKYSAYSKSATFRLPDEYGYLKQVISDDNARILVLPEFSTHNGYNFGLFGNSPVPYIFPKNSFVEVSTTLESKYNNTFVNSVVNDFSIKKGAGVYLKGSVAPTYDTRRFFDLNIEYVILDEHIIGYPFLTKSEMDGMKFALDNSKYYKLKKNLGKLRIYEKITPRQPVITAGDSTFERVNPTEYRINIHSLSSNRTIYFDQSFHDGWQLFLKKYKDASYCEVGVAYENTVECAQNDQLSFDGVVLSLVGNSIGSDHFVANSYANKWMIDSVYVRQNFSKEYYKENPDGSIDVELVLYFKPQSYFYLGLSMSCLTLAGLLGYLGYDSISKRRKK